MLFSSPFPGFPKFSFILRTGFRPRPLTDTIDFKTLNAYHYIKGKSAVNSLSSYNFDMTNIKEKATFLSRIFPRNFMKENAAKTQAYSYWDVKNLNLQ